MRLLGWHHVVLTPFLGFFSGKFQACMEARFQVLEAQDRSLSPVSGMTNLTTLTGSREELRKSGCQELCVRSGFSIYCPTLRHMQAY